MDKALSRVDWQDMRVRRIVPTILPTLLLIGGLCHGQSLGDAARQIRPQKQKDGTAKRVVTTDDLSPIPDPKPTPDPKKDVPKLPYKTGIAGFTPEDWTRSIKAQKDWIAHLQAAAEKLKTLRKVDLNKVATDPVERNFWEERSILEQLASEIPEQQQKLKEAQDDARKAGMPVAVWDPQ
jgi:hypothetical protein